MIDKHIIDGVDVSRCEFALELIDTDRIKCHCIKGLTKMSCNQPESIRRDWCDQNPDCLYKQYSRKKQECVEWKKCNERLLQALIKDQSEIVQKNIDETNILLTKENADLQQQLKTKEQECLELRERLSCNCFDPKSNNNRCVSYNRIAEDYERDLKRLNALEACIIKITSMCEKASTKSTFCNGVENKDMQKLAIRILKVLNDNKV